MPLTRPVDDGRAPNDEVNDGDDKLPSEELAAEKPSDNSAKRTEISWILPLSWWQALSTAGTGLWTILLVGLKPLVEANTVGKHGHKISKHVAKSGGDVETADRWLKRRDT